MAVRFRVPLCVVAFACCAGSSCTRDDSALASIGDQRLELETFQEYLVEVTGEPWQGVGARVSSRLLDQYIDRKVVLEAAGARGVRGVVDERALSPRELRRLMVELCGEAPEPDPFTIENEVLKRMGAELPAQAHVRQILVDTLDDAVAARERLAGGADFVEVSREVSRAPNAHDGGELGFFYQGSLPPEIDRVVFSLAPGAISEPVQGTSGYHVFQVLEVVEPGPPVLSEVEASVRAELGEQATRAHTRGCIAELALEVGVRVNASRLWFPYEGRYTEGRSDA